MEEFKSSRHLEHGQSRQATPTLPSKSLEQAVEVVEESLLAQVVTDHPVVLREARAQRQLLSRP
jgi:hypothetical protein